MPYKLILILWYCPSPYTVIKPVEQSVSETVNQTKKMLTKCFSALRGMHLGSMKMCAAHQMQYVTAV